MDFDSLKAYELIFEKELKDINSYGYLLKHKKTGARVSLILNDDENKVFTIGFRTPPQNSRGVAHIIEHSVLEGSDAFPLKDPFVELCKGSLNTFLNAMTFPDKTLYPVASCNDKDLHNLMHVYLDAVFHPTIYKNKNIFLQEGWRYEMESPEDELKINGIVYNEMKGAFSDVDDLMDRAAMHSLYPDSLYGNESGGDPEFIPDLTYEEFLDFHRRYYHPSNSYIYLYGNVDVQAELTFIDEHYLSHYEKIEPNSDVSIQKPFEKMAQIEKNFAIDDSEEEENNYHYLLNYSIGTVLDKKNYDALRILDYALCSVPGAPLKTALLDAGIGNDVFSSNETGILQPYFSIIAKNCSAGKKDEFLRIIRDTLLKISEEGIGHKALQAAINYYEFKYREADYGSYPKGLIYCFNMFDSWLYDDMQPFMHVEQNDTFAFFKDNIDKGYFEKYIKENMIDNPHKTFVTLVPVKGLTNLEDNRLKEKLAKKKAEMTAEEIEEIVKQTKDLFAWQKTEDSPETLKCIPLLEKSDLNPKAKVLVNEMREAAGFKALFHNIFTNKIAYFRFVFDVKGLSEEELTYFGFFKNAMGLFDTQNYSYGDFYNETNIVTGGMSTLSNIYYNVKTGDVSITFDAKASVLYENIPKAFELMKEMLFRTDYSNKKRLKEVINEMYARQQSAIQAGGHAFAYMRASKGFSKSACYSDAIDGLVYFDNLEKWYRDFDSYSDLIIEKMDMLSKKILRPENFMLDCTCDEEGYRIVEGQVADFAKLLHTQEVEFEGGELKYEPVREGLKSSAQIQYVACAGNYIKKGLSYNGTINVLKVMLAYDYLWNQVRVKGGAYGCSGMISRNGDGGFVSYRDPNLTETVKVFEKCAEYVENFDADERTMTQYIIGAIGNMDVPMTPAGRGNNSRASYRMGLTNEDFQRERNEVLAADCKAIRESAKIIRAIMEDYVLCVVGNAQKIEENRELFDVTRNLFTA